MRTQQMYLEDPYVISFETQVAERLEMKDGKALILASTYFYPESGGQPYDLGMIDNISVTKILEREDGMILHYVDRFPENTHVSCLIDKVRRHDHMQQHSGQHILSAAFVRETGAQTTSFHLGGTLSTIDLDKAPLIKDEMVQAELAANTVVWRGVPITSSFVNGNEVVRLALRKTPPTKEQVRIINVEGFDTQACCGTHPSNSSEVGPIVIRNFDKFKGGTRVEFLCGMRVLRDYHSVTENMRALTRTVNSSEDQLVETAKRLVDDRKTTWKAMNVLQQKLLQYQGEEWMANSHQLSKRIPDLGSAELRFLATSLTQKPGRVVLLGTEAEERAHLVFARSKDINLDVSKLLKKVVQLVGGQGGGSPQIAQGGGPNVDGLDEALNRAKRMLV